MFEKAPELREIGDGISVWTNAMKVLEKIGAADAVREAGRQEIGGAVRSWNGKRITEIPADALEKRFGLNVVLTRPKLQETLLAALADGAVRLDAECMDFRQDGSGVTALFIRRARGAGRPPHRCGWASLGSPRATVRRREAPLCWLRPRAAEEVGEGERHAPRRRGPPDDAEPRPGCVPGDRGRGGACGTRQWGVGCGGALRCYEERRAGRAASVVRRSRLLGRAGQLENPLLCALRNAVAGAMPLRLQLRQLDPILGREA